MVGDAVERERQHQLASSRGPAQCAFGVAHPLAGANHPPQDVGEAGTRRGDSGVEPTSRIDLGASEIGLRG